MWICPLPEGVGKFYNSIQLKKKISVKDGLRTSSPKTCPWSCSRLPVASCSYRPFCLNNCHPRCAALQVSDATHTTNDINIPTAIAAHLHFRADYVSSPAAQRSLPTSVRAACSASALDIVWRYPDTAVIYFNVDFNCTASLSLTVSYVCLCRSPC